MVRLGVDHIGSVIPDMDHRHDPRIREVVAIVRRAGAISSLIPLYTDPDAILDTLDDYRPHIVHFCEMLNGGGDDPVGEALRLQERVRRHCPDTRIMRSIPIGRAPAADGAAVLAMARQLEPLTDYFLTDTIMDGPSDDNDADQPVSGFVGITGLTCDWQVAADLVAQSRIPVVLAGGISPENVAEGIRQVRPFGVDSCTCTNAVDEKGRPIRFRKDPERVAELIRQARFADGQ